MTTHDMNRWSRVQELFLRASALPETEIDAFVQSLEPNEDPLVIDQVWRLLRASGKASQRLQSAIEKVASDLTRSGALGRMTNPELNIKPDSMLGVYRIERELAPWGYEHGLPGAPLRPGIRAECSNQSGLP